MKMADEKKKYEKPEADVKEFAQFENVFTWCNRNPAQAGCVNVTGSGNAADRPDDVHPSDATAHGGGGDGSAGA
jgi:hypothetical protein